jgi:hypothetical protein
VSALLTAISTAPPPGTSRGLSMMLRATPIASCSSSSSSSGSSSSGGSYNMTEC